VHRDDGKRFVVRADEKLTAFVELECAIQSGQFIKIKTNPRDLANRLLHRLVRRAYTSWGSRYSHDYFCQTSAVQYAMPYYRRPCVPRTLCQPGESKATWEQWYEVPVKEPMKEIPQHAVC
jgi:hypothetical protein